MDTLLDVEFSRLSRNFEIRGSTVVEDHYDVDGFAENYAGDDVGILALAGEWKLPKGTLVPASPSGTPDHIRWVLPHHVFPGGDRGPGGIKAGLEIRLFSDSRMESKGTYVVRSRTKHSYFSISAFIHFRYNTSNHPVPEFGKGGVANASGLRHGNGGWREYPFVTSNHWREGATHFGSLLRSDIDAMIHVWCDRDR